MNVNVYHILSKIEAQDDQDVLLMSESCEVVWFALILCVVPTLTMCDTWSGYCDDMCSTAHISSWENMKPVIGYHWPIDIDY